MKPLVFRQSQYTDTTEITVIYILGVPVFKRSVTDTSDSKHRPIGFNVFPSDAPGHFQSDIFEDEEADDTKKSKRNKTNKN